ncbi:MAG TPA: methyltransferase domain-containing protein [bacterium]|nr:methyltransferase domain-containing protein [bacterium]
MDVFTAILALLGRAFPGLKERFWRRVYERMARDDDGAWQFMNYGFDDPAVPRPALDPVEEPDRYGIQLYRHVASGADLRGKQVLEVGSGRGGGAAYLARAFRPRVFVGVDLSPRAASLCRRRVTGAAFLAGNAQALPFPGGVFDAVINVESSHCYADMAAFVREVYRVLRPGGVLLYADLRFGPAAGRLAAQLAAAGFGIVRAENITAAVVRALRLDTPRRAIMIRRKVPPLLRAAAAAFAGLEGTPFFRRLERGEGVYLSFVLRKPAEGEAPSG